MLTCEISVGHKRKGPRSQRPARSTPPPLPWPRPPGLSPPALGPDARSPTPWTFTLILGLLFCFINYSLKVTQPPVRLQRPCEAGFGLSQGYSYPAGPCPPGFIPLLACGAEDAWGVQQVLLQCVSMRWGVCARGGVSLVGSHVRPPPAARDPRPRRSVSGESTWKENPVEMFARGPQLCGHRVILLEALVRWSQANPICLPRLSAKTQGANNH